MKADNLNLDSGIPLAGRYILSKLLGSGGMGAVYLATDSMLNDEQVALKVLHEELCKNEKHTKRFLREVQLTRKVTHPNVVRTFDAGQENGRLFFTMEYAPGSTLKERLQGGPIPWEEAASILREIAKGLYAIHQADIIHRDLKPGNVIISPDGFVKITDFGVAKPGVSDLTGHNEIIGSIPYMSPEVWVGRNVTGSADIYALGVLTYEMLTGVLPFEGDSPAELMCKHLENIPVSPMEMNPQVPEWLSGLVMRMLSKDAEGRPAGPEQIVLEVNSQLDGSPSVQNRPAHATSPEVAQDANLEPSFVVAAPAIDAEQGFSSNPSDWLKARNAYVDMPPAEDSDFYDFENYSKPLRVLFHSGSIGAALLLSGALLWLAEAFVAPWLAGFWEATLHVPAVQFLALSAFGTCALQALVFSTPVLLLAALRRRIDEALKIWWRAALFLFFTGVCLFVVNMARLEYFRSQVGVRLKAEQVLSSARAANTTMIEVALLMPMGTQYSPALRGEAVEMLESESRAFSRTALYLCSLVPWLFYVVMLVERRISRRRQLSVRFRLAAFLLIGALPLGIEALLLKLLAPLQVLFAMRDMKVLSGAFSPQFDQFSIWCSALNWILIAVAVAWVIPKVIPKWRRG